MLGLTPHLFIAQCPNSLNNPVSSNTIIANGFQNGVPSGWNKFGQVDFGISGDGTYLVASNRGQEFSSPSWDVTGSLSVGTFYK